MIRGNNNKAKKYSNSENWLMRYFSKRLLSLFLAVLMICISTQILFPYTSKAYTNTVYASLINTPVFDGIIAITNGDNGVKDPPFVELKAGNECWRTDRASSTWYISGNVDDSFIYDGTNIVGVTMPKLAKRISIKNLYHCI